MPFHKTKCRLAALRTLMPEAAMAHGLHPNLGASTRPSPCCCGRPAIDQGQTNVSSHLDSPLKLAGTPPSVLVKVTQLNTGGLGSGECLADLRRAGQCFSGTWSSAPSQPEDADHVGDTEDASLAPSAAHVVSEPHQKWHCCSVVIASRSPGLLYI